MSNHKSISKGNWILNIPDPRFRLLLSTNRVCLLCCAKCGVAQGVARFNVWFATACGATWFCIVFLALRGVWQAPLRSQRNMVRSSLLPGTVSRKSDVYWEYGG